MVPSNSVLNHMVIPWGGEVIYYCDYFEFGNICMFLTSLLCLITSNRIRTPLCIDI